jgi:hypothetical protein
VQRLTVPPDNEERLVKLGVCVSSLECLKELILHHLRSSECGSVCMAVSVKREKHNAREKWVNMLVMSLSMLPIKRMVDSES